MSNRSPDPNSEKGSNYSERSLTSWLDGEAGRFVHLHLDSTLNLVAIADHRLLTVHATKPINNATVYALPSEMFRKQDVCQSKPAVANPFGTDSVCSVDHDDLPIYVARIKQMVF